MAECPTGLRNAAEAEKQAKLEDTKLGKEYEKAMQDRRTRADTLDKERRSEMSRRRLQLLAEKDIMGELKNNEDLHSNEQICYLGNGSFGIITFRNPSSPIKFFIRKRI